MSKFAKPVTLALIAVAASLLWGEPVAQRWLSGQSIEARTTVAQRYPLRARSKNFYNRSKISYTRGK